MTKNISLLDCTLRDGGHITDGYFGEEIIKNIVKKLVEAKIDIIEVGFLWNEVNSVDYSRFKTIADVKRILPISTGVSKISLMADGVDISNLEPNDGTIGLIRLSFKRSKLDWALQSAESLVKKGYNVSMNPVNCNVYSDIEYIELLQKINKIKPFAFSIVDTFGVMRKSDVSRMYCLVENNLHPDIQIGLHLHENLGLAYSLAQHFIEIAEPKREIIIDCSLLGMGRVPGNLCIEQIMDHLNIQYGRSYRTEPAFDASDDYISPIKKSMPWGYSIPYALSAKYKLHRTYAEYLMEKGRLRTKDIQRILSSIKREKAELFDKDYVEGLYQDYLNVKIDNNDSDIRLKYKLSACNNIVLLAPGISIKTNIDSIHSYMNDSKAFVISINSNPKHYDVDMVFCTNIKRYENIGLSKHQELIVTSNLLKEDIEYDYIISYSDLTYHDDIYCDDSTLMLMNLLNILGIQKIAVAGFDGFKSNTSNYHNDVFEGNHKRLIDVEKSKAVLKYYASNMEIKFLTPSLYKD